jgi:hypothetical protein
MLVAAAAVAAGGYDGGGEREGREEVLVIGVLLEREMDESIRRTAGAR